MLLFPSWPQPQVTCLLSLCMSALMCLSQLEPQCLPFCDWFTSLSLCPGSSMCQSPPFEGQVLWTLVLLFLVIQLHPPFCCCKRCRCEHGCPDPCLNPIFIWLGFAVLFIWVLIYSAGFGVYPRASCIWGKPSSAELHRKYLVLSFGHAPTNGLAILALILLLAVVRLLQVGPVLSRWCLQEHPVLYTHSPARGLAQEGNTPTKGWCSQGDHLSTNSQSERTALNECSPAKPTALPTLLK